MDTKEVVDSAYNAVLLTAGAVGISFVAKAVAGKSLGTPATPEGAAKLAVALTGSAFVVGYLKSKGYVPKTLNKS
jgi:hypothetical protein